MQKNPMSIMTVYKNMLIPALAACLLFSPVRAEEAQPSAGAPCKTLKACLTELQDDPDNRELREKIIKLALKRKTAPAVPKEARRRMARGEAALEDAKKKEDFSAVAGEFEKAVLAAPWLADAYYNLGLVQDKAGDYADAMQSLQLYLLAAPKAEDAETVESLIFKIEYRRDAAAKAKAEEAAKPRGFEGEWCIDESGEISDYCMMISRDSNDQLAITRLKIYKTTQSGRIDRVRIIGRTIKYREFRDRWPGRYIEHEAVLSEDDQELTRVRMSNYKNSGRWLYDNSPDYLGKWVRR